MDLLRLFSDNLLPVVLAAGAGYALAAFVRLEPRTISHVAFAIFAPCLVYQVIVDSHVPGQALLSMMGFTLTTLLALGGVAALVSRWLGWSRSLGSAVVLTVLLPNAGNFGLSANLFAFGEEGLTQASLFFLTSSMLTFTLGVFIASLGRASLRAAAVRLLRVPALWALAAALVMLSLDLSLPVPVGRAVRLLADASIPTFLVILGIQLRHAGITGPARPLAAAVALRLVGGAAVALLVARLFGLTGAAYRAGTLQASMPSAVICMIIATEFDLEPRFVTSVVFLTTLLSPLTLTLLLALLT